MQLTEFHKDPELFSIAQLLRAGQTKVSVYVSLMLARFGPQREVLRELKIQNNQETIRDGSYSELNPKVT
jgi:hypothetical protein